MSWLIHAIRNTHTLSHTPPQHTCIASMTACVRALASAWRVGSGLSGTEYSTLVWPLGCCRGPEAGTKGEGQGYVCVKGNYGAVWHRVQHTVLALGLLQGAWGTRKGGGPWVHVLSW